MTAAAMAAGALLLLGPALLKTRFHVDEVVTTLLLNFIALLFVSMLLDGPMKDPAALGWPQSVAIPAELELPRLAARSRVHSGLLIALALAVLVWVVDRFTAFGFEMRAVGANARAAAFAGMPVQAVVVKTALLSGALAGLAGCIEVAGRAGYVTLDMSPGYGYSGIVIAMLAQLESARRRGRGHLRRGHPGGRRQHEPRDRGAHVHRRRDRRRVAHRDAGGDDARALSDPLGMKRPPRSLCSLPPEGAGQSLGTARRD